MPITDCGNTVVTLWVTQSSIGLKSKAFRQGFIDKKGYNLYYLLPPYISLLSRKLLNVVPAQLYKSPRKDDTG